MFGARGRCGCDRSCFDCKRAGWQESRLADTTDQWLHQSHACEQKVDVQPWESAKDRIVTMIMSKFCRMLMLPWTRRNVHSTMRLHCPCTLTDVVLQQVCMHALFACFRVNVPGRHHACLRRARAARLSRSAEP